MSELAQHKLAVWKYIWRELSTVQQALARNDQAGTADGRFAARLRRQLDQLQQASDAALQELEDTLQAHR